MEAFFIQELLTRYTPRITIKLTKFFLLLSEADK